MFPGAGNISLRYRRVDSGVVEQDFDFPAKNVLGLVPEVGPVVGLGHVALHEADAGSPGKRQ